METVAQAMERMNRAAWRTGLTLKTYRTIEGFLDPGERAAFESVQDLARGRPVLDLGVGGGRTAGIVLPLTDRYVGIDYTPEMVAACRARFPQARIEEGDARDLSRFPDGSFSLVQFSYNGIDAVDGEGRMRVLREAYRVLEPGGAFFFSTFNKHGPDFDGRFHLSNPVKFTFHPLKLANRIRRVVQGAVVGFVRRERNKHLETEEGSHAILLHRAHDFGILVYTTTLPEVRQQLAEVGFMAPKVFRRSDGQIFDDDEDRREVFFHIVARKP